MTGREKNAFAFVVNKFMKTENPYMPGFDFMFPVFVPWLHSLHDIGSRRDIPFIYIWFSKNHNGALVVSVNGNWIHDALDEIMDKDDPCRKTLLPEIIDFFKKGAFEIVSKVSSDISNGGAPDGADIRDVFRATNPPATW